MPYVKEEGAPREKCCLMVCKLRFPLTFRAADINGVSSYSLFLYRDGLLRGFNWKLKVVIVINAGRVEMR